jgi:hypothetical protein
MASRVRYYLHIGSSSGVILDEEGGDYSDLEAARAEARASVRDLVADDLRSGKATAARHIEITDEHGAALDRVGLTVTMS